MIKKVLNIAHRGAREKAPENTLESIQRAIDIGADMVEFDLRQTSDGAIILWHDENFRPHGGMPISISDISFKKLESHCEKNGFRLARFEDVLMEFGTRIAFDIEIKVPEFEKEILGLLNAIPPLIPPVISSFKTEIIKKIRQIDNSWRTALIAKGNPLKPGRFLISNIKKAAMEAGADAIHLNIKIASKTAIKELTEFGYELYIWTVNDKKDMQNLIKSGVQGIVTDKPDLLRSVIDNPFSKAGLSAE